MVWVGSGIWPRFFLAVPIWHFFSGPVNVMSHLVFPFISNFNTPPRQPHSYTLLYSSPHHIWLCLHSKPEDHITTHWSNKSSDLLKSTDQQSKLRTHSQLTYGKGNSNLVTAGWGKPTKFSSIILYFNISSIHHFTHYVLLFIYLLSCNTLVGLVGLANHGDVNLTVAFWPHWSMQQL